MSPPDRLLMNAYQTHQVYQDKCAGAEPLLARLGLGILNIALAKENQRGDAAHSAGALEQVDKKREGVLEDLSQALGGLQHTQAPVFSPGYLPPGMDEGMVCLASIATGIGSMIGKDIKAFGPKGIKGQLALGGAALGAGYLGNKAIHGVTRSLGESNEKPATFGPGRFGFQPANAVNSWGQPQTGTPLV